LLSSTTAPTALQASPAAAASSPAVPQLPQSPVMAAPSAIPTAAALPASVGSLLHGSGCCRPCVWFWKPQGCSNGLACQHCHLCPPDAVKDRKKAKRAAKALAESSEVQLAAHQEEEAEEKNDQTLWIQQLDNPELGTFGSASSELAAGQPAYISIPQRFQADAPLELPKSLAPAFIRSTAQSGAGQWARSPAADHESAATESSALIASSDVHAVVETSSRPSQPLPHQSIGSLLHGTGQCKPCTWFWKAQGCGNGVDCQHCHACPDGEIKARRKVKIASARLDHEQKQPQR